MQPAITTSIGEKKFDEARELAYQTSKFSTLMMLIFAIPLIIEIDYILKLWLINPPQFAVEFCQAILIATVLLKLGWGHHIAICAMGRIAVVQMVLGITASLSLAFLLFLIWLGFGAVSIGYSLILTFFIMTIERILFAKKLVKMSIRYWLVKIFLPVAFTSVLTFVLIKAVILILHPSVWRVLATTILSVCTFSILSWFVVLTHDERCFIKRNVICRVKNVFG